MASGFWIYWVFQIRPMQIGSIHTLKYHGGWTEASPVLVHRLPDLAFTEIGHWNMHHNSGSIILTPLTSWCSEEKAFQKIIIIKFPFWNNTQLLSGWQHFMYPFWSSVWVFNFFAHTFFFSFYVHHSAIFLSFF